MRKAQLTLQYTSNLVRVYTFSVREREVVIANKRNTEGTV
jgi:hypothetical protein